MKDTEKTQTGVNSGELDDELRTKYSANVTDPPNKFLSDVRSIENLKKEFPQFQGINSHRLKYDLLKNNPVKGSEEGILDIVAGEGFSKQVEKDENLRSFMEDDTANAKLAYDYFKSNVKKQLMQGSTTGETVKNTIVKRKMSLEGTEQKRGTASWRNNNPLNLMADKMSADLSNSIRNEGIDFKASDITNRDGTLAEFATYEDGWKAAKVAITEKHANSTVDDFLKRWSNDGYDAEKLGIEYGSAKISNLKESSLDSLMNLMKKHEGWEPGQTGIPVQKYKKNIVENKDKYQEQGLVDEKGNILYNDKELQQLLESDDELREQLINDRYESFEGVLDNEYNYLGKALESPTFQAQAFTVYDNYGSEGLTNYMNILQHEYLDGKVSDSQLEEAQAWYEKSGVKNDFKNFMGSGEEKINFTPPKSSFDTKVAIPFDLNDWTSMAFDYDDEKGFSRKSKEDIIQGMMERNSVLDYMKEQERNNYGGSAAGNELFDMVNDYFGLFTQEELDAQYDFDEQELKEQAYEEISKYEQPGLFAGSAFSYLAERELARAKENNNVDSLFNTLKTYGEHMGEGKWKLDANTDNPFVQVAINGLNNDAEYQSLLYFGDSTDEVILDMNRQKDYNEANSKQIEILLDQEKVFNEETEEWETRLGDGFGGWITGGLVGGGLGFGQMVTKLFSNPLAEIAQKSAVSIFGEGDVSRSIEKFQEQTEQFNNFNIGSGGISMLGDVWNQASQGDFQFGDTEGFSSDIEAFKKASAYQQMPFGFTTLGQYLGAIGLSSKAAVGGAAKFANYVGKIGKVSKATAGGEALSMLQSSNKATKLSRWYEAMQNGSVWARSGQFLYGDPVFEGFQTKNTSLANMVTKGMDTLDPGNHYNAKYRASSGISQAFTNSLTSLATVGIIDNTLVPLMKGGKDILKTTVRGEKAAIPRLLNKEGDTAFKVMGEEGLFTSKELKDVSRPSGGRLKGLKEAGKKIASFGKKGDSPIQWRPDWKEFKTNLSHELDQWAVGDFQKAIFNQTVKGQTKNTIADMTSKYVNDMGDFFDDDLEETLRQGIKHYDEILDGPKLQSADIDNLAKKRYDELTQNIGKHFYNLMAEGPNGTRTGLPFKLAEAFEKASIGIKDLDDDDGSTIMSLAKANGLASDRPNRLVTKLNVDDQTKYSIGTYGVKEVRTNNWAADIAKNIRKEAYEESVKGNIQRQLLFDGIDTSAKEFSKKESTRMEEVNQVWNDLYGQKVDLGNRVGYVKGLAPEEGAGFKVVTEDGDMIQRVSLKSGDNVPEEIQGYTKATGENAEKEATLLYSETNLRENVEKATQKAKDTLDEKQVEKYRDKFKQAIDVLNKVNELKAKTPTGKTMLFDDAHRNQYGFGKKATDFFKNFRESGRATYKMVENLAKNFGVDDMRTLNLVRMTENGNQKRVIGKKNLTEITEWDGKKAAESAIPKDVVVKKTGSDGNEFFFVSNKPTQSEPSRFIETRSGMRMNPDWDMVNKNETMSSTGDIKLYTRTDIDGETWFREAKAGEPGRLLNIQNPTDVGANLSKKLNEGQILTRNIDAYKGMNKDGETVFKPMTNGQVMEPQDAINYEVREAVDKMPLRELTKEEILENVAQSGMFGQAGKAILAGQAGKTFGSVFDEEDSDYWGNIIGGISALGTFKKPRMFAVDVAKRGATKGLNAWETTMRKVENFSKDRKGQIQEELLQASVHPSRPDAKFRQKFYDRVQGISQMGGDAAKFIKNSSFTQSSFSFLEQFNIKQLDQLKHILTDVGHAPSKLKRKFTQMYNTRTGDKFAFENLRNDQTKFLDTFFEGISETGNVRWSSKNINKNVADFGDKDYRTVIDNAISRIMHTGAVVKNGELVYENKANIEDIYLQAGRAEGDKNLMKELDKSLLQDDKMSMFVESYRNWFAGIKESHIKNLKTAMNESYELLDPKFQKLASRLIQADESPSSFKSTLGETEELLWKKAEKEDAFRKLMRLKSSENNFTEIRNYYPQMISQKRLDKAEDNYIYEWERRYQQSLQSGANKDIEFPQVESRGTVAPENMDLKKVREFAREKFRNEKMAEDFWKANAVDFDNTTIMKTFDWKTNTVGQSNFQSATRAKEKLEKMVKENDSLTEADKETILNNSDSYVQQGRKVNQLEGGGSEMEEYYYLKEPQELKDEYGIDLIAQHNKEANNELFTYLTNGLYVKNSNHLENPRQFNLPEYMMETNFDNIMHRYTVDVGERLHFMENGIFEVGDLNRKFLNPISDQITKKTDGETSQKYMTRLREVYKQQEGLPKEIRKFPTEGERQDYYRRKHTTARWVQGIRNGISMGYFYGISNYDMFQHAIMTPLLTSWGSYKKSAWGSFKDKQQYDRMKEVAKTFHYADQKLKTFMPEVGRVAPDRIGGGYLDGSRFANFTNRGLNYAADFSFTKAIGDKTGLWNVDDWGARAMLGEGFYGVNEVATNINVRSHLTEAEELAKIGRQMKEIPEGETKVIKKGNKTYTEESVKNGLELIGIPRSQYDDFLDNNQRVNDLLDYIQTGEGRGLKLDDFDEDPQGFKYIDQIVNTSVDSYHGRNKIHRPEAWNTPWGKLFAQYSFYHNNFGLQTLQRRIRQPIQKWNDNYHEMLKDKDTSMTKLLTELQRGDKGIKNLKQLGLNDDAINALPANAMYTAGKVLPAAGITFAMSATMAGIDDIWGSVTDAAISQVSDKKWDGMEWERFEEQFTFNPYSTDKDKKMIWETITDPSLRNTHKGLTFVLGQTADMGLAGKYGATLLQQTRFSDQSLGEISPVGRELNDIWKMLSQGTAGTFNGDEEATDELFKTMYDFSARKLPIFGSMSLGKKKVKEALFNKPQFQGVPFQDPFGNELNSSDFTLNNDL